MGCNGCHLDPAGQRFPRIGRRIAVDTLVSALEIENGATGAAGRVVQLASEAGRAAGSLLIGAVHCSPGRLVPSTSRVLVPARSRWSQPAGA